MQQKLSTKWKGTLQSGRKHQQTLFDKELIFKIFKELTPFNRNKTTNLIKNGQEIETFPQRRTNGQQVHEKVLNITNHQEHANQSHSELSLHTC